MKLQTLALAAAFSLAACSTTTYRPDKADVPKVLPSGVEEARLHDGVIRKDLAFIEALQGRIKALNDKGIPVEDYQLSRAQCWLSFGLEEYHENDRTGIVETALVESGRIVDALEQGRTPAATQSPVATSVKLRPDLWAKLDALRASPYLSCAGEATGCLEVVLNEAGHDYNETGWRHARGTIAEAERMAAEADQKIAACQLDSDGDGVIDTKDRCPATPRGTTADASGCPLPAADGDDDHDGVANSADKCPNTPPPARVDVRGCEIRDEIKLPGVNFATDSAKLLPESFTVLDDAVATLKRNPGLAIEVQGHTDSRSSDAHNLQLSQRRAAAVQKYLRDHSATNVMTAKGYGESPPIADNNSESGRLQNRRVVLHIANRARRCGRRPACLAPVAAQWLASMAAVLSAGAVLARRSIRISGMQISDIAASIWKSWP